MVAEALLVLVGGVVLLVDHDDSEVLERSEERAARTHRDGRIARAQALPLLEALARAESAVQDRHPVSEAGPQPRHELVRQGDLRHQQQRLAAPVERLGDTARR